MKKGGPPGARIGVQKDPPSGLRFGVRFAIRFGSPIGLYLGTLRGLFGDPKAASFSEPEKLPKCYIYIYIAFGTFRILEKSVKLMSREGPDFASRGSRKSPKRRSQIRENVVIHTLSRFQRVSFGIYVEILFGRALGVAFGVHLGTKFKETKMVQFGAP